MVDVLDKVADAERALPSDSPLLPLTSEQRALIERVATLSRERFAPRAARYDAEASFPTENYRDLHAAGLLGLTIPTAYGGLGVDRLTYALCLLEIAKGCSATALTFNMHATVLGFLDQLATDEQKRRYFAAVVDEGKLVASIGSEPGQTQRDKIVLQTRFRPVEGGYRVSGLKHFCSLGDSADYYHVNGLVEGAESAKEGILSAMVRRDDAGVTVEKLWDAVGMRGTTSHTIRFDSFVERRDIVGSPGGFLTVDLANFSLGYAATYLGIGEAAFDFITEYAGTKVVKPAKEPICHHPLTQRSIAEMGTTLRAARLLLGEAALLATDGDRRAAMLAINQAKYAACEAGATVTTQAMRLAGGSGFLRDLPLERWHRDALAGPVMPPANDRCLETVGKIYCGLEAATLEYQ
jgi:alkylation response protein AidB-like acyl-CoA dehydrogenase